MLGKMLFAFLLITSGVEPTEEEILPYISELREAAFELEIHDICEEDCGSEAYAPQQYLARLQRDYQESLQLPSLCEAEDWGIDYTLLCLYMETNAIYRLKLSEKAVTPRLKELVDQEISEANWLYETMDLLKQSMHQSGNVQLQQRRYLGQLRDRMGVEAFYQKRQIPFIPY